MKIVNPDNASHSLILIPRFYPLGVLVLTLKNEVTQVQTEVDNIYLVTDGKMTITFDFKFYEGEKYEIKINENYNGVYRGMLKATTQELQNYKQTKDAYYYE